MKIAVATEGDMVAAHFGRCAEYTLAQVIGGRVLEKERIANPGHEPGFLPRFLAGLEVEVIIAGGMGPRALGLFAERDIEAIIGATGPVDRALEDYASGKLVTGESSCEHGAGDGHECG